jgi:hypothetical protein
LIAEEATEVTERKEAKGDKGKTAATAGTIVVTQASTQGRAVSEAWEAQVAPGATVPTGATVGI